MWNLTGDDVQRVKDELKGRRAALQAHYDSEVSRLEAELADIERVERFAVNFASNHKNEAPAMPGVNPVQKVQEAAPPIDAVGEQTPFEKSTEADAAPADEKSSSRWRLRLSAGEASP
jgi:hypothetical protein